TFNFVLIEGSLSNANAAFTNGPVYAIAVLGNTAYIGGNFTKCGTVAAPGMQTRINLAAIDLSTGQPTPWNPGCNGTVRALSINTTTVYGPTVFVGGSFTS